MTTVSLSNDRILDTASNLIDEAGADGFSMRSLAARLDVTPMAIYRWFASRDALLDALVDRSFGSLRLTTETSGPWEDRVVAMLVALRADLLTRRPLLGLPLAARRLTTALLHTADDALLLVRELGHDDAGTVLVFRSLVWHVFGFVLVVDPWAPPEGGEMPESVRQATDALAPDAAPVFSGLASRFAVFDADALFLHSSRALAVGLRTCAP